MEVVGLAERMGVRRISELPGVWRVTLADGWVIAVNGHETTLRADDGAGGMEADIPPFHAAVWRGGWLRGEFSPRGGVLMGPASMEGELIAAIRATGPVAE